METPSFLLPTSLLLNGLSGVAGEFLPALLTVPVILQPGIGHPELGFSRDLPWIDRNRNLVIYNPVALFADQIDVVCDVALIAVFHFVEFQRLDDSMFGKLIEGEIDRR